MVQQVQHPKVITPKFAVPAVSLHTELKKRVNQYFKERGQAPTGNRSLYMKAAVLFLSFIGLYVHLVFFTPAAWLAVLECILLGMTTAGIGFNVMHDGGHGSFSTNPTVNTLAAFSADVLGASSFMWNTKHNVIHHAYTNIDGVDDDIDAGMMLRMSPVQQRLPVHRYQHIYYGFLYSFLYLLWVFYADYQKYFTNKVGDVPLKKLKTKDHILFWSFKALHMALFIAVPIYTVGFLPWLTGFLIYAGTSGFILSIVFQLAHVIEETEFPEPAQPANKIEDEWALHQLKTTANFATRSKLITWYVGGLNFQIEHHLFPKISHVHYPVISRIVKQVCQEMGAPYIEHRTMAGAIASHTAHLKALGRQD